MFARNLALWSQTAAIVAAATLAAGCGATTAAGGGSVDLRRSAHIEHGGTPRMLVEGPARLLHLDVHGDRVFSIYSVERRSGTEADCLSDGASVHASVARAERRVHLNLDVPGGRTLCLAGAAGAAAGRASDVSWHARRVPPDAPAVTLYADAH